MSSAKREQIEAALGALESQRVALGDAVVDAAVLVLRQQLAELDAPESAEQAVPQPVQAQRLKQVTILFLDVVGSTHLSQFLDPEETHAVMDGTLARCTAIVHAQGGKVLQYAGDNLLAVFGAEESREDDPERAVHTGLALLAEGRNTGAEVEKKHGHAGFNVRVGIHTGEVLLGGGVDHDGSIRGLAVNIAARMEQSAPPGALRISRTTYHHVRGIFDVQQQAPIEVKGVDQPIVTYLVERAKPRAFRLARRSAEDLHAPMVGRERELAEILESLETARREGRVGAVTVLGEAGLGKSRLIEEFQDALELDARRFWLLLGRADESQRLQSYSLLRDMLAWRLQIADSDSAEIAKSKLVDGLASRLGPDGAMRARLIGRLIGLDFEDHADLQGVGPLQLRDRAFAAFGDYLASLAREEALSVVMLVEDLHWADDGSLDLLEHLLRGGPSIPLGIVMTARPALLERRPRWHEGHGAIDLAPLDANQSRALAEGLLEGIAAVPDQLRYLLVDQAGGNPFYMEELLRMLVDDGVIVEEGATRQVLPDRLKLARVPSTLIGVLQARLDALSAEERQALQQASIVGHVFWDEAVSALEPGAVPLIPALRDKSLVIRRDDSAFEGAIEEAFKHHLLHQVTYDTVLKSARRQGHARAAAWLAARVGDRADEYLAITAEHFERAGDLVAAANYYERAAEDAARRFANAAALEHAAHALRCLDSEVSVRRYQLHTLRCNVADLIGLVGVQEAEVRVRLELAAALGDEALLSQATLSQSLLASRRGDEAQALTLAGQAATLAGRSGAATVAAAAQSQLAWSHYTRGDSEDALSLAAEAVHAARRARAERDILETRTLLVKTLAVEAVVVRSFGPLAQALDRIHEALELALADDLVRSQAGLRQNLAGVEMDLGRYRAAIPHLEAAGRLAVQIGWTLLEATGLYNLAVCHRAIGDAASAEACLTQAFQKAEATQMREVVGRCHLLTGHLHADAGRLDAADAAYANSVSIFEQLGLPHFAAQSWAGRAELARRSQDMDRAQQCAEPIHESLAGGKSLLVVDEPAWAPVVCYRVWSQSGDARAALALERAYRNLEFLLLRTDSEDHRESISSVTLHREVLAAWRTRQSAGT